MLRDDRGDGQTEGRVHLRQPAVADSGVELEALVAIVIAVGPVIVVLVLLLSSLLLLSLLPLLLVWLRLPQLLAFCVRRSRWTFGLVCRGTQQKPLEQTSFLLSHDLRRFVLADASGWVDVDEWQRAARIVCV